MSQEYKISVPKWVLDEKTPIQSRRMETVTIHDEDGNGTLSKGDLIVSVKGNGDYIFNDFQSTAQDRRLLQRFGISDARGLDLKFVQAYFGKVKRVARQASRGKISGEEVIDALLPQLETKGAAYTHAFFAYRGIDHASQLISKVKAGAEEYRSQQIAEAVRLKKEMVHLYAGRDAGNSKAAAKYWKVSAKAREKFLHLAATTEEPLWKDQLDWVFKMDQKAYGQETLRRHIPAKHEIYLANLGKIDKRPGFKTQQKLRQEEAREAYQQFQREHRLNTEFRSL